MKFLKTICTADSVNFGFKMEMLADKDVAVCDKEDALEHRVYFLSTDNKKQYPLDTSDAALVALAKKSPLYDPLKDL